MTKSDDTIREELKSIHNDTIEEACKLLRGYDYKLQDYLANFVAAICNIRYEDLFTIQDKVYISQARWFFWHAYRYMTNDTYEKISDITKERYGLEMTPSGIGISINKMAHLVASEPVWTKRWLVARRIIRMHSETDISANREAIDAPSVIKLTVLQPKDVELKIELKKES